MDVAHSTINCPGLLSALPSLRLSLVGNKCVTLVAVGGWMEPILRSKENGVISIALLINQVRLLISCPLKTLMNERQNTSLIRLLTILANLKKSQLIKVVLIMQ